MNYSVTNYAANQETLNTMKEHLDGLRIDGASRNIDAASSFSLVRVILIVSLVFIVIAGWFLYKPFFQPQETPVLTVPAPVISSTMPDELTGTTSQTPIRASSSTSTLEASGYVVARRSATVSAKIVGQLESVFFEEGDHVESGDIIARLDDSGAVANMARAEANLRVAEISASEQYLVFKRNTQLKTRGSISDHEFERSEIQYKIKKGVIEIEQAALEIARKHLEDTVIRAPFSGIVIKKAAQPGEIVSPVANGGSFTRSGIATIVDMDSLEVEADLSETFIHKISIGQPATVRLNAYSDWSIHAKVTSIIPAADRSRATIKARIALLIKDPRILSEMGVRISFLNDEVDGSR